MTKYYIIVDFNTDNFGLYDDWELVLKRIKGMKWGTIEEWTINSELADKYYTFENGKVKV